MLFGMDCLYILATFGLAYLIGLPFVCLIPSSYFNNKYLLPSIFGYGFVGFAATILYKHGVNHHQLYISLCIVALLISLILVYKRCLLKAMLENHAKTVVPVLLIWLAAFVIILLPYWLGGEQVTIYQGWIHDHFSYLGAAFTYTNETFKEVNQSSGEFFLRSPNSLIGAIELYRRPGIEHLFGVLSKVQPHEMYRYGYVFLAILVANGILAMTFLMTNILNCSVIRATLVSAAIFVGFWGQVFIDFNAWSMTGAMPILLLVTTYIIVAARNIKNQSPLTFAELIPLSCLVGFALYIYPENTFFHLPGLLAVLLAANVVGWRLQLTKSWVVPTAKVIVAVAIGFILSAFYFNGTVGHFIWAAGFSAQNLMTEAVYGDYLQPFLGQANWFRPLFDNAVAYSNATVQAENQGMVLLYILKKIFVEGHLELLYYTVVDGFYGFFGMYFLTPTANLSQQAQEIWRIVIALILVASIWVNFKSYTNATSRFRLLFIFTATLCAMLATFLLLTRIYAMARGLYFVAPYCMVLFLIPFLLSEKIFTIKNVFFIIFLLSQLGFGLARINSVVAHNNPIYPLPYTMARTHYFIEGKSQYDWTLSRFDSAIRNCHRVYVDVPNGWQEYSVAFYLQAKGKEFVKKYPVKTSFWAVEYVGYQKTNGKEDCTISVSKKILPDGVEFNELLLVQSKPTDKQLVIEGQKEKGK
jgi:hypothetical protein